MPFTREDFNEIASQIKDTATYALSPLNTTRNLRCTFFWSNKSFDQTPLILMEAQDLKGAWVGSTLLLDIRYDYLGFPELNAHLSVANISAKNPNSITVFIDLSDKEKAHDQITESWSNEIFSKHIPSHSP